MTDKLDELTTKPRSPIDEAIRKIGNYAAHMWVGDHSFQHMCLFLDVDGDPIGQIMKFGDEQDEWVPYIQSIVTLLPHARGCVVISCVNFAGVKKPIETTEELYDLRNTTPIGEGVMIHLNHYDLGDKVLLAVANPDDLDQLSEFRELPRDGTQCGNLKEGDKLKLRDDPYRDILQPIPSDTEKTTTH